MNTIEVFLKKMFIEKGENIFSFFEGNKMKGGNKDALLSGRVHPESTLPDKRCISGRCIFGGIPRVYRQK